MKHLKRFNEIPPPGAWTYHQSETDHTIKGPSFDELVSAVRNYRVINNLPIPADLTGEVEKQLCEKLPSRWCIDGERKIKTENPSALSFHSILDGTANLMRWWKRGSPRVTLEEATRRSSICADCSENAPLGNCKVCSGRALRNLIVSIVANEKTGFEERLGVCKVCTCSLEAKVWFPLGLLWENISQDQNNKLPDHCWVKKHE